MWCPSICVEVRLTQTVEPSDDFSMKTVLASPSLARFIPYFGLLDQNCFPWLARDRSHQSITHKSSKVEIYSSLISLHLYRLFIVPSLQINFRSNCYISNCRHHHESLHNLYSTSFQYLTLKVIYLLHQYFTTETWVINLSPFEID